MSNLLKSKFLLGVAVFALALFVASSTMAADGAITKTLKKGMKDVQVKYLQQTLNEKGYTVAASGAGSVGSETTYFGPATVSAVKKFQAAMGLVADGIFGAKSRASLGGAVTTTPSSNCPAGALFNPQTGAPCTSTPVVTNPTGPVAAVLASDTPASGYIVGGQATADLAHFTFTGSGTVNTIVLQRTGVSDQDTLSNVYVYDGATRITDGYSFNNTGALTMNNLGIVVNGSKTISVKADVAVVTNASTVGITLTSYTAVGGTAVTANLMGNTMTYGQGNLATVYLNSNTSSSTRTVNAGTSAYTVWSAPLQVNTRAVYLKGANFRMTGSAPSDALANIKLYVDGIAVGGSASVGTITGTSYAMFDFSAMPVNLSTGTHTVDLRADVVKGSSYKLTVSVQQASDLVIYDPQVGVNLASKGNAGGTFTANSAGEITINAGSASTIVDPTFQSMTNITGGATNVVIGKFKVHGYGEDVKVSTLPVLVLLKSGFAESGATDCTTDTSGDRSAGTCGLNNVTLYFNGSQVGSSKTLPSASMTTALEFSLGSQLVIPAGVDSYIEVRADLQTTGGYNYTSGTISAQLNGLTSNAQGQVSKATISFPGETGSNITGTALTIQTGVLAVAANSAYTAQSISPNTTGAKIASYILQNQSSSESVRVTSLKVDLYETAGNGGSMLASTGTTPLLTNFSNLKTSETSGSGSLPVQPQGSNTFSVDFTIAPGATKTVDVFADTGADATYAFLAKLTATSLGSSSNVSIAQNSDGNAVDGQTISLSAGVFANAGSVVSSSTVPQFVAAANGATDATKATFNFKSASGTATVSELKFKVTTSTGASVSAVRVGNVTAPVVSGIAYLTGLNIAVPNGGAGVNVDAYMTYGPVATGAGGNTSGAFSFVEMTYIKYQSGNTTAETVGNDALATGTSSATATLLTTYSAGTFPAAGSTASITFAAAGTAKMQPGMKIVAARDSGTPAIAEVQSITDSTHAVVYGLVQGSGTPTNIYFYSVPQTPDYASSADNCTVNGTEDCMIIVGSKPTLTVVDASTQLVNGLIKVGSVTVAADAKGDIALNTLPLAFASTGTVASTLDPLVVKNAADQSTINTSTGSITALTAGASTGAATLTFTGGYTITAGQTVTFDIYATTTGVSGGPNANVLTMTLGTASGLTWTDVAGNGTSAHETGTLIYNYPTNSSVVKD